MPSCGSVLSLSLCWLTTGLKTALVERDDFSCGTSSKSTKLIHGGVRYLYKAFLGLDFEQVCVVEREERGGRKERDGSSLRWRGR